MLKSIELIKKIEKITPKTKEYPALYFYYNCLYRLEDSELETFEIIRKSEPFSQFLITIEFYESRNLDVVSNLALCFILYHEEYGRTPVELFEFMVSEAKIHANLSSFIPYANDVREKLNLLSLLI